MRKPSSGERRESCAFFAKLSKFSAISAVKKLLAGSQTLLPTTNDQND
jgi:hypothetical protein